MLSYAMAQCSDSIDLAFDSGREAMVHLCVFACARDGRMSKAL